MRRILTIIDEDIVHQFNRLRQSLADNKFSGMLNGVWGFRMTWLKLVAPLIALSFPALFLSERMKTI